MPTPSLSTVEQTYSGNVIECAMFYCPEQTRFDLKNVCPVSDSYYFEGVIRSSANRTITLTIGDVSHDIDVTDSFQRYTQLFASVDSDYSKDGYFTFPAGTYFLWNVQIEAATTPSAWRPAPEDAEDYTQEAILAYDDAITQLDIFNKLTNNGAAQGIYLLNGRLYLNADYIQAGTLSANRIYGGTLRLGGVNNIAGYLEVTDDSGNVIGTWDKDGLHAPGAFVISSGDIRTKIGSVTIDRLSVTEGKIYTLSRMGLRVDNESDEDNYFGISPGSIFTRLKKSSATVNSALQGFPDSAWRIDDTSDDYSYFHEEWFGNVYARRVSKVKLNGTSFVSGTYLYKHLVLSPTGFGVGSSNNAYSIDGINVGTGSNSDNTYWTMVLKQDVFDVEIYGNSLTIDANRLNTAMPIRTRQRVGTTYYSMVLDYRGLESSYTSGITMNRKIIIRNGSMTGNQRIEIDPSTGIHCYDSSGNEKNVYPISGAITIRN